MVRRYLFALVSLFLVEASDASTARRRTFVPRKPTIVDTPMEKSLKIRGGALVPKTSVAKVATTISLLQGAVAYLDPKSACESYGISTSPVAEIIMRRLGVVLIQMGILGVCLFFKNCSIHTAIGAASLGFVVEIARSLLQNEHKTIGFALGPQIIILLQCSTVAFVNLWNQKYADAVSKANAVWVMLNGILFALLPKWVLEVGWGWNSLVDGKTLGMVSGFGYWFVAYAAYLVGLAWDVEATKALTWSRFFILLIHVIPSRGDSIGMDKSKQMILLAYQAIIFATLAF